MSAGAAGAKVLAANGSFFAEGLSSDESTGAQLTQTTATATGTPRRILKLVIAILISFPGRRVLLLVQRVVEQSAAGRGW